VFDEFNQLVTAVLQDEHSLDPEIYASGDLSRHRRRITRSGNRVIKRMWGLRDWTFKYVDAEEITLLANTNEVLLPQAWVNEGRQGGVWTRDEPRYPLRWARSGVVRNMIQSGPPEDGQPIYYSVSGQTQRKLLVTPKDGVDRVLVLSYEAATPTLLDGDSGDIGNIDCLPFQWRHILYEWIVAREMKAKGSLGEYAEQMRDVAESLFDMVCNEHQGKPGLENAPPYAGAPIESDWLEWM
jgi:hypothetical protein